MNTHETLKEYAQKVAHAAVLEAETKIRDGKYILGVERVWVKNCYGRETFVAEFRVEQAEQTEPDVEPNVVGSTCSIAHNLGQKYADGPLSAFLLALYGVDKKTISKADIGECLMILVNEDPAQKNSNGDLWPVNPARGRSIGCTTKRKANRGVITPANKGNIMTVPTWSPVNETQEAIQARRARYDAGYLFDRPSLTSV